MWNPSSDHSAFLITEKAKNFHDNFTNTEPIYSEQISVLSDNELEQIILSNISLQYLYFLFMATGFEECAEFQLFLNSAETEDVNNFRKILSSFFDVILEITNKKEKNTILYQVSYYKKKVLDIFQKLYQENKLNNLLLCLNKGQVKEKVLFRDTWSHLYKYEFMKLANSKRTVFKYDRKELSNFLHGIGEITTTAPMLPTSGLSLEELDKNGYMNMLEDWFPNHDFFAWCNCKIQDSFGQYIVIGIKRKM